MTSMVAVIRQIDAREPLCGVSDHPPEHDDAVAVGLLAVVQNEVVAGCVVADVLDVGVRTTRLADKESGAGSRLVPFVAAAAPALLDIDRPRVDRTAADEGIEIQRQGGTAYSSCSAG